MLTAPNEQFTIKMDFAQRFSGFNKTFKPGAATRGSLVEQARALILANYTDPATIVQKPAVDSEDYPKVANTLAHWRFFGGVAGQPVKVGETVADVTGANPIRRAPLNIDGVAGAQEADLVWSGDHHYLSAAPGSVRFLNTDKNTARMSYFTTDVAAPINPATVPSGYTVEAFLKIDKDWTAQKHAWMNVMTRDGKRGDLAGFSDGDPESPPLLFALSSLREVQWKSCPKSRARAAPRPTGPARSSPTSGCTWPSSTTRSRMKPCCTSRARRCCATPATRLAWPRWRPTCPGSSARAHGMADAPTASSAASARSASWARRSSRRSG